MGTFGNVTGTLYKAHVYRTLFGDLSRFLRRTMDEMDFDKESLLNRVGLTTYTPVKRTVGAISFFLLGAAVGAAIGLALAPKPGAELRADVKERALDLFGHAEEMPPEHRVQA
jgi:hypothetical protein